MRRERLKVAVCIQNVKLVCVNARRCCVLRITKKLTLEIRVLIL